MAEKLRALVSLALPIYSYGLGCMTLLQAELNTTELAYINLVARLMPMSETPRRRADGDQVDLAQEADLRECW